MTKKKMQEEFKGLNLYNKKEYKDIWDKSIIVLDTNILLNQFRYSKDTRENFLTVLNSYKDRIWIPYQVIREYYKNRDRVIKESNDEINNLENIINQKYNEILEEIKKDSKKIQSIDKLKEDITQSQEKIKETIADLKAKKEKESQSSDEEFETEKALLELIEDRYEDKYEYSEIEEVIKEGDKRIKEELPPGYKDVAKEERYKEYQINGDYIIFNSIIKYAKDNKTNIILITDDTKEDWFQEVKGEKIGGRRELLHEFNQKTGQLLLIYSSEGFINNYNKNNPKTKVSEETVKEIETVNNEREWISLLEKGNSISEKPILKYYHYKNELSNWEKIQCIKDIANKIKKITDLLDKYPGSYKKMLAEDIINSVIKIEQYEIKGYEDSFDKIKYFSDRLVSNAENERFSSFTRYINMLLEELNKII